MRSGTLGALGVLLVVVAAAYPVLAVTLALLWSIVARTAERSVTALVLRRHHKGMRPSDTAMSVAAGPVHLVGAVIATAAAAIVPAVVGAAGVFAALLVTRGVGPQLAERTTYQIALTFGMLMAVVAGWWGPGGTSLRRGSRSLARGIAPTPSLAQFAAAIFVAVAVGLVAFMRLRTGMPIWTPWTQPPAILTSLDLSR